MRKKKNENLYVILILIMLFGVSIGYAVLTKTLNITGNSSVRENTWDIHFENVQVSKYSVTATKEPTLENSNTSVNFSFMLDLPGDYYEFTVDAVNRGTIDAMIDSITKTPELTTEQAKYLNYIIEYQNGEQIASKQLISKNSLVRIKVRVEFRRYLAEEDMPTTNQSLDLGFTLNYVQADSTATSVKDNGVFMITANGLLDDIGTIVTIGAEQFYTIGTEGDNVKLLSMYNLHVGNKVYKDIVEVEPILNQTGMQSNSSKGYFYGEFPYIGTTHFSSDEQKGTNFSDYNGSIVEGYVNNYEILLETKFGVDVVEARLITKDELTNPNTFACDEVGRMCLNSPYSWIYSTSYWVQPDSSVWGLSSNKLFSALNKSCDNIYGVRPVIVLKKSDIVVKVKPIANGDINEIGTIVTIGSEQFYTIGTEGDNVKLLSMYNLYVGGEFNYSKYIWTPYGNEATGIQNMDMKGYISGHNIRKGTTVFSSEEHKGTKYSDYNGSMVENYVNNYRMILESEYGVELVEARLITKDELIGDDIGCTISTFSCADAPNFIYSTSYWIIYPNDVWIVNTDSGLRSYSYTNNGLFGVRPVIVISKDYFRN